MTMIRAPRVQSYDDAIRWIYERIDYERIPPVRSAPHFQLDRVRRLLELIDAPQERIAALHIAGTKGKGSTAAMLDSILRASGIRSSLFTSPHLESFEERMTVDGQRPTRQELMSLVQELQQRLETASEDLRTVPPTYFEVATLLAWMYFDRHHAEVAVLETGLGGRLDCTNVCKPLVTVITNISLDHTTILGDTIEQIASEKAGIIKTGVPLITGVTQPSVIRLCENPARSCGTQMLRLHCDIQVEVQSSTRAAQTLDVTTPGFHHQDIELPLLGIYQAENAALAVAVADLLSANEPRITSSTIREGLRITEWPLRFEVISGTPTVVLDAAHNPAAVRAILNTLNDGQWPERPRVLVFAASREKNIKGMLELLLPEFDYIVLTEFHNNPRSCPLAELAAIACWLDETATVVTSETSKDALKTARDTAGSNGLIFVTGSVFVAAECRVHGERGM